MILLTGATGFIGQHLLKDLCLKYGAEKIVLISSKHIPGIKTILRKGCQIVDSESKDVLDCISKINVVIHLGAFIPKNNDELKNDIESDQNVRFTENLCNLKFAKISQFIFVSSVDVYAVSEVICEDTGLKPLTNYAKSKLACENLLLSWKEKFKIDLLILRLGHTYGPGEAGFSKVIPSTFKKIMNDEKVEIWGTGSQIRSFIFVKDVTKAIIQSIETKISNSIINLVSSKSISISDLIKLIVKISNSSTEVLYKQEEQKTDNLLFDNSLMRAILNVEETDLEVGLREEWQYFQNI